ncbi:MAG: hypothetical protein WC695_05535 [Candidatus Omnitrophota bacterium]
MENTKIPQKSGSASIDWECVKNKRILFGHQSVGDNIVDGIKDVIANERMSGITVKETVDSADFVKPVFAHFHVGRNKDPRSKIDDFKKKMETGLAKNVDIAFFKFCFVDIVSGTNIEEVFNAYTVTLDALQKEFPQVVFLHVMVPLMTNPSGIQARVKRMLGAAIEEDSDNNARKRFNLLLAGRYGADNRLFDLAKLEIDPRSPGRYSLNPSFTDDGGHLNSVGREFIGKKLLEFVSQACKNK